MLTFNSGSQHAVMKRALTLLMLSLALVMGFTPSISGAKPPAKASTDAVEYFYNNSAAHRLRLADTVRRLLTDEKFLTLHPEYHELANNLDRTIHAVLNHDFNKNNLPANHPIIQTLSGDYGTYFRSLPENDPRRINLVRQIDGLNSKDGGSWEKAIRKVSKKKAVQESLTEIVGAADYHDVTMARKVEFGDGKNGVSLTRASEWIHEKSGELGLKKAQADRMVGVAKYIEGNVDYAPTMERYTGEKVAKSGFGHLAKELRSEIRAEEAVKAAVKTARSSKSGAARELSKATINKTGQVSAKGSAKVFAKAPAKATAKSAAQKVVKNSAEALTAPVSTATSSAVAVAGGLKIIARAGGAVTRMAETVGSFAKNVGKVAAANAAFEAGTYLFNDDPNGAEDAVTSFTSSTAVSDCQTVLCSRFMSFCKATKPRRLVGGQMAVVEGTEVILTTETKDSIKGQGRLIPVDLPKFPKDLKPGSEIAFNELSKPELPKDMKFVPEEQRKQIKLVVTSADSDMIKAKVVSGGTLQEESAISIMKMTETDGKKELKPAESLEKQLSEGEISACARKYFFDELPLQTQTELRKDPDLDALMSRYAGRVTDVRCEDGDSRQSQTLKVQFVNRRSQLQSQKVEFDDGLVPKRISIQTDDVPTQVEFEKDGKPGNLRYWTTRQNVVTLKTESVFETLPRNEWLERGVTPIERGTPGSRSGAVQQSQDALKLVELQKQKFVSCCGDKACRDYYAAFQDSVDKIRNTKGAKSIASSAAQ